MAEEVGLILFAGKQGTSALERLVYDCHAAIAKDILAKAHAAGGFSPVIVATSRLESFDDVAPGVGGEPTAGAGEGQGGKTGEERGESKGIYRVI